MYKNKYASALRLTIVVRNHHQIILIVNSRLTFVNLELSKYVFFD